MTRITNDFEVLTSLSFGQENYWTKSGSRSPPQLWLSSCSVDNHLCCRANYLLLYTHEQWTKRWTPPSASYYTSTVWWLSKIDRSGYLCLLLLCCTLVHALKEIFNKGKNGGRKKEGWDQNQFHSVTHVLQTLTLGLTLHNLVLSTMLLLWKLLHCCTVLSSTKHFLRYFIRFTKQIIITKRTA